MEECDTCTSLVHHSSKELDASAVLVHHLYITFSENGKECDTSATLVHHLLKGKRQ